MSLCTPRIVIVGAGASGIAAATRLLDKGYDNLVVLEARNRIGGRIHSVDFGGSIVDIGAQWCHGEDGNIVYDLVKDLNLLAPSKNAYNDYTFFESSGKLFPKSITDKLYATASDILYDEEALADVDVSLGQYFIDRFKLYIEQEFKGNEDNIKIGLQFLEWYNKQCLCIDPAPTWFNLSPKIVFNYKECDGFKYYNWKNRGYKSILDVLMKKYPNPSDQLPIDDKINLNKEVTLIKWQENDIKNRVIIECQDGSSFSADHAILTFPLGFLKRKHKTLFNPQLPEDKQRVISGCGFGTVIKAFLKFPVCWWPAHCKGFSFLWNEDDIAKTRLSFPGLTRRSDRSWLEDVLGLYVIDNDEKVLLVWIVGEQLTEIEALSDATMIDGLMYLLKKFLGTQYEIPPPCDILRSFWKTDKYTFGTYSYRSTETDAMNVFPGQLSEPVVSNHKQVLMFAGEATHPHFFSTVHGAIESGFREADRIINIYNHPKIIKCKVAIVGAGMAGLGAADTLANAGLTDFIILEAQDYAGGRIKTVASRYELGAQWIHGTDNSIYNFARKFRLLSPIMSDEGLGVYVRNDGLVFDNDLVKEVNFKVQEILKECEQFLNAEVYPKSVGHYLQKQFAKYTEKNKSLGNMKEEMLDWHVRFQMIDNSCLCLENLSARDWGKFYSPGNDCESNYNLSKGYESIVNAILCKFSKNKVRYNQPVTKIEWNNLSCHNIKIYCDNNLIVYCDHIIVTVSLGVLKDCIKTLFKPALPYSICKTIECMGYDGGIGKIFLKFKYKWWNCDGFQLLWKKGTTLSEEINWTRYITGFDAVYNDRTVLLGWVGGEGVAIMENLSEEEVGTHCVNLLRRFLHCNDIPYPIRVVRSTWTRNPWIRGGYSYISTDCDALKLGPSDLSKPVIVDGAPRILLAGEACHTSQFSTTHGAFQSGQNQAKVILDYYKLPKYKLFKSSI